MAEKRRAPDDRVEDLTERHEPKNFKKVRLQLTRHHEGLPEKDIPATDTDDELSERTLRTMHVKERVHDILAAMYYDIHQLCCIRNDLMKNRVRRFPELEFYKGEHQEAAALIDRTIRRAQLAKVGQTSSDDLTYSSKQEAHRVGQSFRRLSFLLFAICALSEAFRLALCKEDQLVWQVLVHKIAENSASIATFARSRGLDWQGLLLKHADKEIPWVQQVLSPISDLAGHFHEWVITNDSLRKPRYERHRQINIDHNLFNPSYFKDKKDPTIRVPDRDGRCDLCYAEQKCGCRISGTPRGACFVELVDYPPRGIGVRALTRFKKGEILDQYFGELRPVDYQDDHAYALLHESKMVEGSPLALISAKRYGNWTRFLNHSCKPSTMFLKMTVGKRITVAVQAVRDIDIFEEITIDYGKGYWKNRVCLCGEPDCHSQGATKEETET
ncbi:hypothetical protein CDV55_108954 [Aspergillus turcosus]|uniref:SET domain-containing protein n=1 Tax=Aspergillus turcosus TaxID=1245748 RepID=A0A229X8R5_9EURO|nr:hypothetical protein CDV55_108954 [Aspergillus turcosus]RLM00877.1 hypothetical protein CFD26_106526 [Aspergillus turcosus]